MKQFGLKVPENKEYEEFLFKSKIQNLPAPKGISEGVIDLRTGPKGLQDPKSEIVYAVEGDWSGGAFLLVAGAIAGPITIRGLDMISTQADKAIMEALSNARANVAMEAKGIKIHPSSSMKAFEFDATDCPDLFPPLTALASCCDGQTKIKGVSRLMHKESNRAVSLQEEFGKMGVKIEVDDNSMIIHGGNKIKGAKVHSHHDHRIAMACAVAALKANNETTIEEADAVKKSYPDFYDDLIKLGADVSLSSRIKLHE
jgi:3-phosphoshikimate 1-carboxyvinyltransferase